MLANIAEAWKLQNTSESVLISSGVHSSDWEMYPDCSPDFFEAASAAIHFSTAGTVYSEFPFYNIKKSEIFNEVLDEVIDRDSELVKTFERALKESYSCYRGGKIHCGTCPTCIERNEAMLKIFKNDPTIYEHAPKTQKKNSDSKYDDFDKELVFRLAKHNISNCEVTITHYSK